MKYAWDDPTKSSRFPASDGWKDGSQEIGFADVFDCTGRQLGPMIVAFDSETGDIWENVADDDGNGNALLWHSRHPAPLRWIALNQRETVKVRIAEVSPTEDWDIVPMVFEESKPARSLSMSPEKLRSILAFYDEWLDKERHHVDAKKHDAPTHWIEKYQHLRWMCRQCIDVFIPAGEIEKSMRWLGFIRGVLFERGDFTIEQLRDHSRS
jgi:hypothetical protein